MRYKYRNYWIWVKRNNEQETEWDAIIWINGHRENKETVASNIFSLSMAQIVAESYIDKVLSIGGILQ